jgi:hypothetical protein
VTSERRQTVRESAQFLREVRPIDPEEVATYVEGGAHPATIREDLRTLAPELGLIELEDGTFVPVPDGPLESTFDVVTELPAEHVRAVENLFVDHWGPGWASGTSGQVIRAAVAALKSAYEAGEAVAYDTEEALAYTYYHLPTHYAASAYVLDELGRDGLLGHHLRVLDVGAGVGGSALALVDYLPDDALLKYHAIEPSAAMDVLESLLSETGPNVHPTLHSDRAETADPEGPFDLILFSSVLNELATPVQTAADYLEYLADDGTVALVSTGDLQTSTTLRSVERTLADDRDLATVYAPTVRLWPDHRPTDRGWTWTREPDLETPAFQTALADGDSTHINTSVRYSYALLRLDGRQRHDITLSRDRWAPMAESPDLVTERVDVVGAKLSPNLGADNPLYKVSDGSESVDHYAVLVHESPLTAVLRSAPYGSVLTFENALLLWNDDEGGYNLVIDDEAVVEHLT